MKDPRTPPSRPPAPSSGKSKSVREQALETLRQTRQAMDPALLIRMNSFFSKLQQPPLPLSPTPVAATPAVKPAAPLKPVASITSLPRESSPPEKAKLLMEMLSQKKTSPAAPAPTMTDSEPTDRQKITEIVVKYMKLREDLKRN